MEITKKEISENTRVKKHALQQGLRADYSYFYENDRYQFSADTKSPMLEMWDKKHNSGDISSYPGTYHSFDGHKKEFVNMVHHLIT